MDRQEASVMNAALTIRDARADDLARIVAIYNEAIPGRRATADTEPVSVDSRRAWFLEHGQLSAARAKAIDCRC